MGFNQFHVMEYQRLWHIETTVQFAKALNVFGILSEFLVNIFRCIAYDLFNLEDRAGRISVIFSFLLKDPLFIVIA